MLPGDVTGADSTLSLITLVTHELTELT